MPSTAGKQHKSNVHRKIKRVHTNPFIPAQSSAFGDGSLSMNEQQDIEHTLSPLLEPSENALKYLASHSTSINDLTAHDTDEIDLLRVRAQISSAGYECPDLCRRLGETAEDAVVRVLEQYRKVNTKGPRVSPSMSKSRSRELEQASQEWLDHRAQLEAKDSETRDLQQQLLQKDSRSIEDAMKHKAKLASLKEEKRSAIKKLYQECEALKVEVATLTLQVQEQSTTYAERLKRDKEQLEIEQETHERRLHDIQKHVGKEVLEKQKDHESSLDRLRKQLDAERATRETYMAELETAKALVRQQELHAKAQFDKQEKRYIEASLRERAVHGKEMADYQSQIHHQREHLQELQKTEDERTVNNQQRMAIELQKQKTSLTEQHNAEKYALLVIIEDFKLASATRDRPKGLTDTDLVTRFSKLAQDVEDFARLEWDPACEAQRWTQQLNQLNPRNRRKLKQKLIQNSLWISLHEHVFRSPYRLLAAEQEWQDLDKPWIEIYAFATSSSQWQAVAREVEKTRCESAKQLRALIDPSIKADTADRLQQLKAIYEKAIASAVANIAAKIEQVAILKEKDRVVLYKIVRTSAEIWFECCSQRYRILMTLASGVEDVLGVSEGNIRLVKVVLKPALRRFGNAHGDNLTVEEPIVGWRQEVEVYPPQRVSI